MQPCGSQHWGPAFAPRSPGRRRRRPWCSRAAEGSQGPRQGLGSFPFPRPGEGPERAGAGRLAAGAPARVRDGSALGPARPCLAPARLRSRGPPPARLRGEPRGPGAGRPRKLGRGRSRARPAEGVDLPALRKEEEPAPEPP